MFDNYYWVRVNLSVNFFNADISQGCEVQVWQGEAVSLQWEFHSTLFNVVIIDKFALDLKNALRLMIAWHNDLPSDQRYV